MHFADSECKSDPLSVAISTIKEGTECTESSCSNGIAQTCTSDVRADYVDFVTKELKASSTAVLTVSYAKGDDDECKGTPIEVSGVRAMGECINGKTFTVGTDRQVKTALYETSYCQGQIYRQIDEASGKCFNTHQYFVVENASVADN